MTWGRRPAWPSLRTALAVAVAVTVAGAVIVMRSAFEATPIHGSGLAAQPLNMAGVAPGACVVYPPAAAGTGHGRTVFVDAGHGGVDPGIVAFTSSGQPVFEKDLTLAVASKLATRLEADGYRVAMSRTADTSVAQLSADDLVAGALTANAQRADLLKRAACADASNASLIVSVHFNSVADPGIGGTQTFYGSAPRLEAASHQLADDVESSVVAATGAANRGVWSDAQMPAVAVQLGASAMPGIVTEPLFLTSPDDLAFAMNPVGQERIALGLKIGIETFLSGL